jgi:ribosomal protein S27AE
MAICKDCHKARMNKRRAEKLDEIRAYDRRRGQDPDRKELVRLRGPKYRDKPYRKSTAMRAADPLKASARTALGNAVRDGYIIKPPQCQMCGRGGRIHGHHNDYSKPLEVRWVCTRCHGAIHRAINEAERSQAGKAATRVAA